MGRKLATQGGDEDREGLFRQLVDIAQLGPQTFYRPLLDHWIDAAIDSQPLKRRLRGEHASWYFQNLQDAVIAPSHVVTQTVSTNTHLIVPQPSCRRKSILSMSDDDTARQREHKERAELSRWSSRLFNLLESKDTPTARQVLACLNPGRAMLEIAGSTRAKTLKSYVLHWYRFEAFLQTSRCISWPLHASDYVDFLHMLADEPCAPSVPETFLMAARFIERKSGLPADEIFAVSPVGRAVRQRITEQLSLSRIHI